MNKLFTTVPKKYLGKRQYNPDLGATYLDHYVFEDDPIVTESDQKVESYLKTLKLLPNQRQQLSEDFSNPRQQLLRTMNEIDEVPDMRRAVADIGGSDGPVFSNLDMYRRARESGYKASKKLLPGSQNWPLFPSTSMTRPDNQWTARSAPVNFTGTGTDNWSSRYQSSYYDPSRFGAYEVKPSTPSSAGTPQSQPSLSTAGQPQSQQRQNISVVLTPGPPGTSTTLPEIGAPPGPPGPGPGPGSVPSGYYNIPQQPQTGPPPQSSNLPPRSGPQVGPPNYYSQSGPPVAVGPRTYTPMPPPQNPVTPTPTQTPVTQTPVTQTPVQSQSEAPTEPEKSPVVFTPPPEVKSPYLYDAKNIIFPTKNIDQYPPSLYPQNSYSNMELTTSGFPMYQVEAFFQNRHRELQLFLSEEWSNELLHLLYYELRPEEYKIAVQDLLGIHRLNLPKQEKKWKYEKIWAQQEAMLHNDAVLVTKMITTNLKLWTSEDELFFGGKATPDLLNAIWDVLEAKKTDYEKALELFRIKKGLGADIWESYRESLPKIFPHVKPPPKYVDTMSSGEKSDFFDIWEIPIIQHFHAIAAMHTDSFIQKVMGDFWNDLKVKYNESGTTQTIASWVRGLDMKLLFYSWLVARAEILNKHGYRDKGLLNYLTSPVVSYLTGASRESPEIESQFEMLIKPDMKRFLRDADESKLWDEFRRIHPISTLDDAHRRFQEYLMASIAKYVIHNDQPVDSKALMDVMAVQALNIGMGASLSYGLNALSPAASQLTIYQQAADLVYTAVTQVLAPMIGIVALPSLLSIKNLMFVKLEKMRLAWKEGPLAADQYLYTELQKAKSIYEANKNKIVTHGPYTTMKNLETWAFSAWGTTAKNPKEREMLAAAEKQLTERLNMVTQEYVSASLGTRPRIETLNNLWAGFETPYNLSPGQMPWTNLFQQNTGYRPPPGPIQSMAPMTTAMVGYTGPASGYPTIYSSNFVPFANQGVMF